MESFGVQDMRNLRKKRCALTPRFRKYNLVNGLFSRLPWVCGIEPVLHQQHSDGSWYATPRENGKHRRSSAPTSIWILPKSSRSLQCDGKWRSHSRRRVRTSESKLNASGPKKRSRAPHQYCSASTVWFVSGRTKRWKQIRCHMLQRGIKRPTIHSQMQLL